MGSTLELFQPLMHGDPDQGGAPADERDPREHASTSEATDTSESFGDAGGSGRFPTGERHGPSRDARSRSHRRQKGCSFYPCVSVHRDTKRLCDKNIRTETNKLEAKR